MTLSENGREVFSFMHGMMAGRGKEGLDFLPHHNLEDLTGRPMGFSGSGVPRF
jgi:hypothetical protein